MRELVAIGNPWQPARLLSAGAQQQTPIAYARLLERGWDWSSLVAGGSAGIATLPIVGIAHAILDAMQGDTIAVLLAPFYAVIATAIGSVVIMAVGVPVAAFAWQFLRPVRAQWIHVLAFGLLGGALVAAAPVAAVIVGLASAPADDWWSVLTRTSGLPAAFAASLAFAPYGIVAAATGRIVAGARHARTARRLEHRALTLLPDVSERRA